MIRYCKLNYIIPALTSDNVILLIIERNPIKGMNVDWSLRMVIMVFNFVYLYNNISHQTPLTEQSGTAFIYSVVRWTVLKSSDDPLHVTIDIAVTYFQLYFFSYIYLVWSGSWSRISMYTNLARFWYLYK